MQDTITPMENLTRGLTLSSILEQVHVEWTKPIIRTRFRLPIPSQAVAKELMCAYEREVRTRGLVCELGDDVCGKITKVSEWLTSPSMKPMLLLYGGIGTGKTTMSKSVVSLFAALKATTHRMIHETGPYKTTDQQDKRQAALFDFLVRLQVPEILPARKLAKSSSLDGFEKGFLIIDDLGCEPSVVNDFGTRTTPLIDLLYARYDAMQPTIVSTNLTLDAIASYYGDKTRDRFDEVFATIGYTERSYRGSAKRL